MFSTCPKCDQQIEMRRPTGAPDECYSDDGEPYFVMHQASVGGWGGGASANCGGSLKSIRHINGPGW